eukprot:TRINITY_DN66806_c1_g1_i2.p2 TRINITY_DN66806_c1_g1~~TRINITY_DN66806_c1_g1_i2.p2  ORF type:complete len:118 (+),score=11.80 TRINITY_DN66806_c1_g1_i2:366-719(+)
MTAIVAPYHHEPSSEELARMAEEGINAAQVKKSFGTPPNTNYQSGHVRFQVNSKLFRHNLNTLQGWSGAPIYQYQKGSWKVVGMHQRALLKEDENEGISWEDFPKVLTVTQQSKVGN